MTKKVFIFQFFLFGFLSLCGAYGQEDARSKKIIDDMAARFKTYPTVSVAFSVNVTKDQSETEQEGKIWLKNNQYKLEIPGNVFYYDGSKIYQYLPDVKEVNITKPDSDADSEDFQLLNPQAWFNISSKSFKSKWIKESQQNNRRVDEIDLYPIHIKTAQFSRIRIMVEKTTLQLVYLKAFMNDGSHYALTFKPYEIHRTALPDSFFTFNVQQHPGVEVNDLTF
jgi:outer membrane lipoprotein-sorting protein